MSQKASTCVFVLVNIAAICLILCGYIAVITVAKRIIFMHYHSHECNLRYGDSVDNTAEENSSIFSPNPNALVAVSKGMRAAKKLCTNKILQFLTGGAS